MTDICFNAQKRREFAHIKSRTKNKNKKLQLFMSATFSAFKVSATMHSIGIQKSMLEIHNIDVLNHVNHGRKRSQVVHYSFKLFLLR